MTEVTLTTFLTLDGVMQAPGGPGEDTSRKFQYGGWLVPHADADLDAIMNEIFFYADAFLLGRTTYDIFSNYWPRITDPNDLIARKLNTLPKFVVSHTQDTFSWNKTTHVRDVKKELDEIKKRFSRELQVHGSCDLAQTLIKYDLIDEYRLLTFPVVLGSGKRLFGPTTPPATLSLVSSKTTGKGVLFSVYRRAGELKTGSFALE